MKLINIYPTNLLSIFFICIQLKRIVKWYATNKRSKRPITQRDTSKWDEGFVTQTNIITVYGVWCITEARGDALRVLERGFRCDLPCIPEAQSYGQWWMLSLVPCVCRFNFEYALIGLYVTRICDKWEIPSSNTTVSWLNDVTGCYYVIITFFSSILSLSLSLSLSFFFPQTSSVMVREAYILFVCRERSYRLIEVASRIYRELDQCICITLRRAAAATVRWLQGRISYGLHLLAIVYPDRHEY